MTQALRNPTLEASHRSLLRELALEAEQFRFDVAPNPCVGAAVLAGERVVARGFHQQWGGLHAEPAALNAARLSEIPESEWDTLVVTLEPCSTEGKTPACTDRILASGIKNVIVSELDPDPRHRGAGLALLEQAGLTVTLLEGGSQLAQNSSYYLRWNSYERVRRPRPWVIAKWAQTRSGQLTPPEEVGAGRWISSPESLKEVQVLRSSVDAIVTGVRTVLADDPRLTVRTPGNLKSAPARIVLDTELRTPIGARILQPVATAEECGGPTWIVCRAGADSARHRALAKVGVQIASVKSDASGRVSLRSTVDWLWGQGARRVLLECGPTLLTSFLTESFVDQLRIYSGDVNGGRGPSMADWLNSARLQSRLDRTSDSDSVLESFVRTSG